MPKTKLFGFYISIKLFLNDSFYQRIRKIDIENLKIVLFD